MYGNCTCFFRLSPCNINGLLVERESEGCWVVVWECTCFFACTIRVSISANVPLRVMIQRRKKNCANHSVTDKYLQCLLKSRPCPLNSTNYSNLISRENHEHSFHLAGTARNWPYEGYIEAGYYGMLPNQAYPNTKHWMSLMAKMYGGCLVFHALTHG